VRLSACALAFSLSLGLALPGLADTACETVPGNIVQNCGFEDGTYTATIPYLEYPPNSDPGVPNLWGVNPDFIEDYLLSGVDTVETDPTTGADSLYFGDGEYGLTAELGQYLTDVPGVTYAGNIFSTGSLNGLQLMIDNEFVPLCANGSFSFVGRGSDTLTLFTAGNDLAWDITGVVVAPAVPEPRATFLIPAAMLLCLLSRRATHRLSESDAGAA